MPKLKLNNGVIKYKTYPLYPGVKRICKEQAAENLLLVKRVLDENGVKFILSYGTLLGAVRNHDFIDHDEDIDLALLEEYKDQLFNCLPQLLALGFEVARYDRKGLISVIRKGEYIDFYFFKPYKNNIISCVGNLTFKEFFTDTSNFEFKGASFQAPTNYIKYLEFEYGKNWKIPVEYNNYNMPSWKIKLFEIKEYIKELLPDKLYFLLSKSAEKHMEEKYLKKIADFTSHN